MIPAWKIGDLDTLATIERQVSELDPVWNTSIGGWVPLMIEPGSPTVARRVWAKVQDARPSREERLQHGAAIGRHSTYVWIRWLPLRLDTALRFTLHRAWGDDVMQVIGGPAVLGRNEYLEFELEKYTS